MWDITREVGSEAIQATKAGHIVGSITRTPIHTVRMNTISRCHRLRCTHGEIKSKGCSGLKQKKRKCSYYYYKFVASYLQPLSAARWNCCPGNNWMSTHTKHTHTHTHRERVLVVRDQGACMCLSTRWRKVSVRNLDVCTGWLPDYK